MTLDQIKGFVGDLARPFAIISTSLSAAVATVIVALKVDSFEGAALYIGAVYGGVAGIYGFKAWEQAKVEVAKAQAPKAEVGDGDPTIYGGPRP